MRRGGLLRRRERTKPAGGPPLGWTPGNGNGTAARPADPEPADTAPLESEPVQTASAEPDPDPPRHAAPVEEPPAPAEEKPAPVDEKPAPVEDRPAPVAEKRAPATFVGPLEAMLRHPFLTLLPILLAIGAAVYFGIDRKPEYTSEARISVGRADVPAYTVQNVVIGNSTLAAGYARAIGAPGVVEPAGRAVAVGPKTARSRLKASPIPGSTLIRVEAKGPSEQAAVDLANAGSKSLVTYVTKLNAEQEPNDLLTSYRRARTRVARLQQRLTALNRGGRRNRERARRVELDLEVATLRASTLGDQYRGAQANTVESLLQVISPADEATSDQSSFLQRLILLAAAAGLLIGMTLALLRANARLIGRRKK
jgi:hypothetical protein